MEAQVAVEIAKAIHETYIKGNKHLLPTIISPYAAQVNEIKKRWKENNLPSSENFVITAYHSQGKEYPCVIVSLVRKNPFRKIGFLDDEKLRAQIYVACSRAQAKLIILISRDTFGEKPLYERITETESPHALLWGWD